MRVVNYPRLFRPTSYCVGRGLLGVKDGVNAVFHTQEPFQHTPSDSTLAVYLNGVRQYLNTDYTVVQSEFGYDTIIFAAAPSPDDYLSVDYVRQ